MRPYSLSRLPDPALTLAWTVNDVLSRHPSTVTVFTAFGIDACCGGAKSVGDACARKGVDANVLLEALRATIASHPGSR